MPSKSEPFLFREVLQCFARFPERDDTLNGIVEWWLLENRIAWSVVEVQAALDELVARGFVIMWATGSGQKRYKANPARQTEIEELAAAQER